MGVDCEIGDDGGRLLATALQRNKSLQSMDLSGANCCCASCSRSVGRVANHMGEGSGHEFATVLRMNSTLTALDLSGVSFASLCFI